MGRATHRDLLHRLVGGLPELHPGLDAVDRRLPAGVAGGLEAWVAEADIGAGSDAV